MLPNPGALHALGRAGSPQRSRDGRLRMVGRFFQGWGTETACDIHLPLEITGCRNQHSVAGSSCPGCGSTENREGVQECPHGRVPEKYLEALTPSHYPDRETPVPVPFRAAHIFVSRDTVPPRRDDVERSMARNLGRSRRCFGQRRASQPPRVDPVPPSSCTLAQPWALSTFFPGTAGVQHATTWRQACPDL